MKELSNSKLHNTMELRFNNFKLQFCMDTFTDMSHITLSSIAV